MRVFLTGATGLIGSHVLQQLVDHGHQVTALVRDNRGRDEVSKMGGASLMGRVEDPNLWESLIQIDAIVHSAAILPGRASWSEFLQVNVESTRMALTTAGRTGSALVHVSSVAIYGLSGVDRLGPQVDEDHPLGQIPRHNLYAHSKRMAEEILWKERGAQRVVAIRPCVVYGVGDRHFTPRLASLARWRFVPRIGPGDNVLSLVHAGSVASAIRLALEHPDFTGAVNVTNDAPLTQNRIFDVAEQVLGRTLHRIPLSPALASVVGRILSLGRRDSPVSQALRFLGGTNRYSSRRASEELGWSPEQAPSERLREALRHSMGERS